MKNFKESILALITETSVNHPSYVRCSLAKAIAKEDPESQAGLAMSTISVNIDMAVDNVSPICQDTGMPTFFIHTPQGVDQLQMKRDISEAIESLHGKVTVVLIAHRLSTVRNAQQVIYMSEGEIRAAGTFEEVRKAVPDFDRQAQLMGL